MSLAFARIAGSLLLCSAFGCAESPEEIHTEASQIVGGTPDTRHEAVVAIRSPQHPLGTFCTGTVVAPTVVVTAAHCIYGAQQNDADVFVFVGADVDGEGVTIPVVEMEYDLEWKPTDLTSESDVGVLRLESPVDVTPIAMGSAPAAGTLATLIGYGFDTEDETGIGVRRSIEAEVATVAAGYFDLIDSRSCDGDSGGAILVPGPRGAAELVGVHSQGTCGESSSEARVDVQRAALIDPFIARAACAADGQCGVDCPDPDPDCAVAEGGGGAGGGSGLGGQGTGGEASSDGDRDEDGCLVSRGGSAFEGRFSLALGVALALQTWRRRSRPRVLVRKVL